MDETPDCEHVAPLLAELATGAATGHDRALALWHVSGCADCRDELAQLARVADDLLLLAPTREPPSGFEDMVMRRLVPEPVGTRRLLPVAAGPARTRPTRWRMVAAAAAVVLAAILGGGLESWRNADDRQLADRYRQALAQPGGELQRTAAVTDDDGAVVGRVYLYPGPPSWVMVAISAAPEPGDYTMEVVTAAGHRYAAGVCPVTGTTGTIGYPLPVPSSEVTAVELARPGLRLRAHPS